MLPWASHAPQHVAPSRRGSNSSFSPHDYQTQGSNLQKNGIEPHLTNADSDLDMSNKQDVQFRCALKPWGSIEKNAKLVSCQMIPGLPLITVGIILVADGLHMRHPQQRHTLSTTRQPDECRPVSVTMIHTSAKDSQSTCLTPLIQGGDPVG